jgi:hypothetical protein
MAFTFEKLIVYQKAFDFADRICQFTEQFPRGYGFLVDQLNRAALVDVPSQLRSRARSGRTRRSIRAKDSLP